MRDRTANAHGVPHLKRSSFGLEAWQVEDTTFKVSVALFAVDAAPKVCAQSGYRDAGEVPLLFLSPFCRDAKAASPVFLRKKRPSQYT